MKGITTHVLDTASGLPAAGVAVRLERQAGASWQSIGDGRTDANGRLADLLAGGEELQAGRYRLCFESGAYFEGRGLRAFHPVVEIQFEVEGGRQHCHVPLLVSPYGFTTYRGS